MIHTNANDVYILTGDLNEMDFDMFEVNLGFVQLVKIPTHERNIVDKFVRNRPDIIDVEFIKYLVNNKHKRF